MATAALSRTVPQATGTTAAPPRHQRGYSPEIFESKEDRDRFSCGFCSRILRDPVQAECGHRFCQNCQRAIEESAKAGTTQLCRFCKEEGMSDEESKLDPGQMFPDKGISREMGRVTAKCPNEPCLFKRPFRDYIKHEEECEHQPLTCERCGEPVQRQKMEQHNARECPHRVVPCQHCQTDMPFANMTNHLKDCPNVPESCSQCKSDIPRNRMRKHQSRDCQQRTVTCPLERCGSPLPVVRFQQHVQKEQPKHLAWVLGRITDIDNSIAELINSTAPSEVAEGAERPSLEEWMDSLQERLQQLEGRLEDSSRGEGAGQGAAGGSQGGATGGSQGGATGGSQGGVTGGSQQGMATGGTDGDGAVAGASATAAAGDGGTIAQVNAMELKVNTLEPIISVLHGEMNRCISAIEALENRLRQEAAALQECRQRVEQQETRMVEMTATLAQKNEQLCMVETRLLTSSQDKPDGTLLWRIPNFSQVRQQALAGTTTSVQSRPFYTGTIGYKMSVRLYPNGDGSGKGTHLSLFFTIMRSAHDALLPWPFRQKVYFMVIDQNFNKHIMDAFRSEPNSSSFQRPTSEMNIATGCPMFMRLADLNQQGSAYLKDDTLYVRVVVDVEGLEEHIKQFDPRSSPMPNAASS